ncbi:MAG: ATP-binding protein [Solirubrobacterales bacterium]
MELKLELESNTGASAEARDELRILAGRVGDRTLADLLLVVSELISNSVKFGPGVQIDVRLAIRSDGSIAGLVVDGGNGRVAIRETDAAEPGGFGLQIVDQVSSAWGVRPRTSDVWFELPAPATAPSAAPRRRSRPARLPLARPRGAEAASARRAGT